MGYLPTNINILNMIGDTILEYGHRLYKISNDSAIFEHYLNLALKCYQRAWEFDCNINNFSLIDQEF